MAFWMRVGGVLALGALWAFLFEPFAFPNNDYFSFERAAESLAAGEWPASLKRGPILPALMAVTAPLLRGQHPELRAALLWNLFFSLGFVALLFRFAWRTFPEAAAWFALLVATTPVLHAMALQPLVEPSLAFFVALAFVLFRERSLWQYAAAAAAALSRPEAAALPLVLAGTHVAFEGSWRRHAALAGAALLPFVAWNALGAGRGSGAASYGDLMQAPSLRGVLLVGVHYVREGLFGWSAAQGAIGLTLGALLGGAVAGLGFRGGVRRWPREAWAMLAWLTASSLAVAIFGISKSRYVLPTVWIVLAFAATGAVELGRLMGQGRAAWARLLPALLLAPLAVGGVLRGATLYGQVRDQDRGVVAAARWLGEHLGERDRVAIVHTSQVLWATDLDPSQVVAFGTFEAEDTPALRSEMRERGVTHVAWTWRRPGRTPSQQFYDERKKLFLAQPFATGAEVPGFELVATLPAPPRLGQPPARIYQLIDAPSPPARE